MEAWKPKMRDVLEDNFRKIDYYLSVEIAD